MAKCNKILQPQHFPFNYFGVFSVKYYFKQLAEMN